MPSEQELVAELKALEIQAESCGLKDGLVESVQAAFNKFDTDKSGFIDNKELAFLTKKLGFVMDDDELKEAFDAMDSSKDGKISFDEFFNWWTLPTRGEKSKSIGMQAALRAKLEAQFLYPKALAFCRQLSESKDQETSTFGGTFKVGDMPEGKNLTKIKFEVMGIDKPAALVEAHGCGCFASLDFVLNEGVEDAAEKAKTLFEGILAFLKEALGYNMFDKISIADTKVSGNILTMVIAFKETEPERDPTKFIDDWKSCIEEMGTTFTLGFNVNDLINGENMEGKKLEDLVSIYGVGKTVLARKMFTTFMTAQGGRHCIPFLILSAFKGGNVKYEFGKVSTFTKVAEVMTGTRDGFKREMAKPFQILGMPALQVSSQVKQMMTMASMMCPEEQQGMITTFRDTFKTIAAARCFTGGGLQVQLSFENFVEFSILPEFGSDAPC